ncbi:hypothetical protein EV122DRAFT_284955 [Schizophyllum commune]
MSPCRTYRREARAFAGQGSRQTTSAQILTVLVETGCIFCSMWALYVALIATDDPDSVSPGDIVLHAYHPLSGIYPTVVILVVGMRRLKKEMLLETRPSRGLCFADSGETELRMRSFKCESLDEATAPTSQDETIGGTGTIEGTGTLLRSGSSVAGSSSGDDHDLGRVASTAGDCRTYALDSMDIGSPLDGHRLSTRWT